jgi:hypothetical protein
MEKEGNYSPNPTFLDVMSVKFHEQNLKISKEGIPPPPQKKNHCHIISLDVKQLLSPEKFHHKAGAYLKWILISAICICLDEEP